MKLISKERQDSKVVKKYDQAKTPCQRVLAKPEVSKAAKQALRRQFGQLDPVKLLSRLEYLQDRLWQYAHLPARSIDGRDLTPETAAPVPALAARIGPQGEAQEPSVAGGDGACRAVPIPDASPSIEQRTPARPSRSERLYRKTKRKGRYHLVKHTWRTRADPFAEVWEEVEQELTRQPHLEAKRLFRGLQERYPGRFKEGQLRTMQRRVKAWRLRRARFVAEEIGLILTGEAGDGLAGETMPVVVKGSRLIGEAGGQVLGPGGLCTGEQVRDLFASAQRYNKEIFPRHSLGYVPTTGVPRWSG